MNSSKPVARGKKTFVISLGGSLINPSAIDTKFLEQFRNLISKSAKKGNRFIIITGGGRPAREYQEALKVISKPSLDDLDIMGIFATRFNAGLLSLIFKGMAEQEVIVNFKNKNLFKRNILIAGGWKPGRSSDGSAVQLAKIYNADTFINLSNIDYVYTKDPRKFPEAKKIESIYWKDFISTIVGTTWKPGANLPFDPTAAKQAKAMGLNVIIANGKNLANLESILEGEAFVGTTIR